MVNKWVQSIKTIIFEDGSRVENPHFVCHHDENEVQLCGGIHYNKEGVAIGHIDDPGFKGKKGYYCKKISDNELELVVNIQADTPTKTGRIYSKEVLKKAIEEAQEKIKEGKLFGYLGIDYNDRISSDKISHLVNSLRMDDEYGQVYSEIHVLDNPNGKIVKELLTSGKTELTMYSVGKLDGMNVAECNILSIDVVPSRE